MYLQEIQTTLSGELECVHFDLERMGNQLLECSIGTGDPSTRSKSGKRHFRAHLTGDIEGRCTRQMEIFLAYLEIRSSGEYLPSVIWKNLSNSKYFRPESNPAYVNRNRDGSAFALSVGCFPPLRTNLLSCHFRIGIYQYALPLSLQFSSQCSPCFQTRHFCTGSCLAPPRQTPRADSVGHSRPVHLTRFTGSQRSW